MDNIGVDHLHRLAEFGSVALLNRLLRGKIVEQSTGRHCCQARLHRLHRASFCTCMLCERGVMKSRRTEVTVVTLRQ